MKTPIHTRLICCLLAFVVLAGSTGFGTVEHWCQMRGYSKSSVLASKGCAKPCQVQQADVPASGDPVIRRMACCKTTLSYEHIEVSSFAVDQLAAPASPLAAFIPNPLPFTWLLVALLPSQAVATAPPLADDPLHRTGRFRLATFCSWLI